MKAKINKFSGELILSITMIVKNEGELLARCLKALQPLRDGVPSELIITDTGSTDDTVAIAERFGAKVLHFDWFNDFSAARNFGLMQCKASWVMFIDADEFLCGAQHIVSFLTNFHADTSISFASYYQRNYKNHGSRDVFNDLSTPRIARRTPGLRFVGKIHECFDTAGITGTVYTTWAYAEHWGYDDMHHKDDRNNEYLIAEVTANPPLIPRGVQLSHSPRTRPVACRKSSRVGYG